MSDSITEYRLTFEMGDRFWSSQHENCEHKNNFAPIWDEIPWEENPIVKCTLDPSVIDQFNQLKLWAETKEQPIRNVTLETRQIAPRPWEPYEP
jgi:hypothetical protein